MRSLLTVLIVTSAAACAPKIVAVAVAPADAAAAEIALQPGTGSIRGSALLRQRGGGVVTCAGHEVFLVPATESASTELRRIFGAEIGYVKRGGSTTLGGGTLVAAPKPNRRAVCDAQGFFTFDQVRAGRWHVITSVVWEVGEDYQGGTLLTTTEVAEGAKVEIVLSN